MYRVIASARRNKWLNIFVIYLRYLIGGAFVFSSIPKIAGERFTTANGEFEPINSWNHFFEALYRSGMYWEFLGWVQLLAGLLLMTQLYSTLAAIIFLPVILNIFVITVSLHFHGTPFITGLMLLANVFLLLWDCNKLRFLLTPETQGDFIIEYQGNPFSSHNFWACLGMVLFATTVLFVNYFNRNPLPWFLTCVAEGLTGLICFSIYFSRTNKLK